MYYFASDIHLGYGSREESLRREKLFVRWLHEAGKDARAIFIVGDMFDFWYEYKRVIPKGFSRLLGALSELTDRGVEIHFFPGNHDLWAYGYLRDECGVILHKGPAELELYGKKCYITHGDDICARASGFWTRFMNGVFRSGIVHWLFSKLMPPNQAVRFGNLWSAASRKSRGAAKGAKEESAAITAETKVGTHAVEAAAVKTDDGHEPKTTGPETEGNYTIKISESHLDSDYTVKAAEFYGERDPMVKFARKYLETRRADYFIFGHNHCAEVYPLNDNTTAIFLGEWICNPTYAVLAPESRITLNNLNSG